MPCRSAGGQVDGDAAYFLCLLAGQGKLIIPVSRHLNNHTWMISLELGSCIMSVSGTWTGPLAGLLWLCFFFPLY